MKIKTYGSVKEAQNKAAERLITLVSGALADGEPVLLLVSGGSSLSIFQNINANIFSSGVTVIVTDERFDPTGVNNNFRMLQEMPMYQAAVDAGVVFVDTMYKEGQTLEGLGNVMDHALSNWIKQHRNGRIFSTVGVGSDGHLCGMMPYVEAPEKFNEYFNSKRFAIGYDAGNKNEFPLRATVTMTFLKHVDEFVGYAVGEAKRIPLKKMLTNGTLSEIPARFLKEAPGNLYTDLAV